MTSSLCATRNRRGLTLVEMLVSMTVFLVVLAGALKALSSQSSGFSRGADEMGIVQNMRFGVDLLTEELRTAGANTPSRQPSIAYAARTSFAFNSDLVSNLVGDISAIYVDPNAPVGQITALPTLNALTIPGSAPAVTYPLALYPGSMAETVSYWFQPDSSTARPDDFFLFRKVNTAREEVVLRNVLAPVAGSFFRYYRIVAPAVGAEFLDTLPGSWYPLRHSAPNHGQLPDTGVVSRIDDIRAVEVRYQITNGASGAAERIRDIQTVIPLHNVGLKKLQSCGDRPLFGQPVAAVYNAVPNPTIDVSWNAAVDEAPGTEEDIIRYVIYRRVAPTLVWGDPYASIPSGTPSPYLFTDPNILPGDTYTYAVEAQDCTPALSTRVESGPVLVP